MPICNFSDISKSLCNFRCALLFINDLASRKYPFSDNFKKIIPYPFIHDYLTEKIINDIILYEDTWIKLGQRELYDKKI